MNFDEILDNCIEAIEQGQSIETCLALYPAHAPELEPLLALVGSLRAVSMPEMSLAAFDKGRTAVAGAAQQQELTLSASEVQSDYVYHDGSEDSDVRQSTIHPRSFSSQQADIPKKRFLFAMPAAIRPLAGVAVAVLLAVVTASLLFMLQGPLSDLTSTLSSGDGSSNGVGTIENAGISNKTEAPASSGQSTVPLATLASDSVIVEVVDEEVPTATPLPTNPLPTSTPLPPTSTAVMLVPTQAESSSVPNLQDEGASSGGDSGNEQGETVNPAIVNEPAGRDTNATVDTPASNAGGDGSIAAPAVAEPVSVPSTAVPSTAVPPTSVPPTAVPPTFVPPTAVPPTSVPPTAVPPAPESSTNNTQRNESENQQSNNRSDSNQEDRNSEPTATPPVEVLPAPTAIVQAEVQPEVVPTIEVGDSSLVPVVVVVEPEAPTDTVTIETESVLLEAEVVTTSEPSVDPVDSSTTLTTTVEKPSITIITESKTVTLTTAVSDGNDAEPVAGSTDTEETPIIRPTTDPAVREPVEPAPELQIPSATNVPVVTLDPSATDDGTVVLDETPEPADGTGGEYEEPVDPSSDEPDPESANQGTSGEEQPTASSMTLPAPTDEPIPTAEPVSEEPTAEPAPEAPSTEPVSSEEPTTEPAPEPAPEEPTTEEPTTEPVSDDPTEESPSEEPTDEPSGGDESGDEQDEDTRRILAPTPEPSVEESTVEPSEEPETGAPVEGVTVEVKLKAPLEKPKPDQPDIPYIDDENLPNDKDNNRIDEPSAELADPASSTK